MKLQYLMYFYMVIFLWQTIYFFLEYMLCVLGGEIRIEIKTKKLLVLIVTFPREII
jgi:hypothetical protein